jgi:sn-glycerol 3-phosphate transport system permease protein
VSSDAVVPRGVGPRIWRAIEVIGAWVLGLLWLAPLLYALWAAFHDRSYAVNFKLTAPLTLDNFVTVWQAAPFDRYYLNTILLVSGILLGQLVLGTMAAFAFARYRFFGREVVFALVLVQLMIMPDVLISENYSTIAQLGLVDTIPAIGLPYIASAFGIFLLRQQFKSVPKELDEAAEVEGCTRLGLLWRVYLPLAKPTIVAYGLVSVSTHWNNFLWPLVVTNSVEARPLTVGLAVFNGTESGVNWTLLSAATVLVVAPLLLGFLLFQRQFVQSFMRAGIR